MNDVQMKTPHIAHIVWADVPGKPHYKQAFLAVNRALFRLLFNTRTSVAGLFPLESGAGVSVTMDVTGQPLIARRYIMLRHLRDTSSTSVLSFIEWAVSLHGDIVQGKAA